MQQPDLLRQPLVRPRGGVVACHDAAPGVQREQPLHDLGQQPVHARRVRLHHGHVAVAVHDQAGQPVRLGVDEAVVRAEPEAGAQGGGVGQAPRDERGVHGRAGIARDVPGGDQAVRVEQERAVAPAAVALDPHRSTRRPGPMLRAQRQLVAEHPGVARTQAPVMVRQQTEERMLGHQARVATATPASVSASAASWRRPSGSPSRNAALNTPTMGTSSVPIAAVLAGRRRSAPNQAM